MTATLWRIEPLDTWALSVCEVAGIAGAHVEGCYVEVPDPADVLRLAAMFPDADVVGMADGASITIPTPTWGDVTFWTALEPVVVPAQDGGAS